jgi:hypothetical protein
MIGYPKLSEAGSYTYHTVMNSVFVFFYHDNADYPHEPNTDVEDQ